MNFPSMHPVMTDKTLHQLGWTKLSVYSVDALGPYCCVSWTRDGVILTPQSNGVVEFEALDGRRCAVQIKSVPDFVETLQNLGLTAPRVFEEKPYPYWRRDASGRLTSTR